MYVVSSSHAACEMARPAGTSSAARVDIFRFSQRHASYQAGSLRRTPEGDPTNRVPVAPAFADRRGFNPRACCGRPSGTTHMPRTRHLLRSPCDWIQAWRCPVTTRAHVEHAAASRGGRARGVRAKAKPCHGPCCTGVRARFAPALCALTALAAAGRRAVPSSARGRLHGARTHRYESILNWECL